MYDQQGNIILDANGYPVFSTNTGIFTKTTQNAANWSTLVQNIGKDGTVTAASIALSINNGQSNAIISADHVYLDSAESTTIGDSFFVTSGALWVKKIMQFGATAGNIVTINNGTVNAPTLQVNSGGTLKFSPGTGTGTTISLTHAIAAGLITAVQIDGPTNNTYKLQYKSVGNDSWADAGTFSRATTLSGAWSSGTYTVTASPQGDTISTTPSMQLNGSNQDNFSVELLTDESTPAVTNTIYGYLGLSGSGSSRVARVYKDSAKTQYVAQIAAPTTNYSNSGLPPMPLLGSVATT